MFISPDGQNTGNLQKKILKIGIYIGNLYPIQGKFEVLKIEQCIGFVMGCSYSLLTCGVIFELGTA